MVYIPVFVNCYKCDVIIYSLSPDQLSNLLNTRWLWREQPITSYADDHGVINPAHTGKPPKIQEWCPIAEDTHTNTIDLALNFDL